MVLFESPPYVLLSISIGSLDSPTRRNVAQCGAIVRGALSVLEALGNIGDFLGGIGVLITLLYLANQIKNNSKSVSNAAAESVLQSMTATLQTASSNPQIARVMSLGQLDIDQLTDDEKAQFAFWLYGWFRVLERAYAHFRQGYVDPGEWEGHTLQLTSVMASSAVQQWWEARRVFFGPDFAAFIDGLDPSEGVPSVGAVARTLSSSHSEV